MTVVFRADGLPLASRVDYWREIISNVFMPLDLRGESILQILDVERLTAAANV